MTQIPLRHFDVCYSGANCKHIRRPPRNAGHAVMCFVLMSARIDVNRLESLAIPRPLRRVTAVVEDPCAIESVLNRANWMLLRWEQREFSRIRLAISDDLNRVIGNNGSGC